MVNAGNIVPDRGDSARDDDLVSANEHAESGNAREEGEGEPAIDESVWDNVKHN